MKKIELLLSILTLISVTSVVGQQDPHYTQYMYNMNIINPAYAGSRGVTSIGVLGRTQWIGIEDAPSTFTLDFHSPISNAVGLGLSVIHDEIGPVKENNIYGDFSYTIFTSDDSMLAFGLKVGLTLLDVRALIMTDPDPLNIPIHQVSPNFGAGIYYYTDTYYVGLSAPNFLESRHLEDNVGVVSTASEKMHYFLTGGLVFDLNHNLKFKPSTLIKATFGAPLSIDLTANMLINNVFELGLSYRFDDSLCAIVGFQVNKDFRMGYAYDHTTSNFGAFNSGSHELLLLFDFNEKNIKSPRFF